MAVICRRLIDSGFEFLNLEINYIMNTEGREEGTFLPVELLLTSALSGRNALGLMSAVLKRCMLMKMETFCLCMLGRLHMCT